MANLVRVLSWWSFMLRAAPVLLCLSLVAGPVRAAEPATGSGALALAALVGQFAPISAADKSVLARLLDGRLPVQHRGAITVTARAVTCRASDVDIAAHDCTLDFGRHPVSLTGRKAHELDATLIENGVAGDGAAGSIYEALSDLDCTIDPKQVNARDGSGATCRFGSGTK